MVSSIQHELASVRADEYMMNTSGYIKASGLDVLILFEFSGLLSGAQSFFESLCNIEMHTIDSRGVEIVDAEH